jgi:hypothetical protein
LFTIRFTSIAPYKDPTLADGPRSVPARYVSVDANGRILDCKIADDANGNGRVEQGDSLTCSEPQSMALFGPAQVGEPISVFFGEMWEGDYVEHGGVVWTPTR